MEVGNLRGIRKDLETNILSISHTSIAVAITTPPMHLSEPTALFGIAFSATTSTYQIMAIHASKFVHV